MDIGTKIDGGRYTVRRPFGRWALGSVYLVEESGAGRMLVMRSLPEIFSSAETEFFQHFEKVVAEILKLSAHPGIIPSVGHVFDAVQKRRFFLSLYVEGGPLAEFRKKQPDGRVSPHAALELARKIAVVLNHAHLEGVCHRNLNPGNVIIQPNGDVSLVNFGLAYALRALAWSRGVAFDQKVLQEQVPYASPEQYVVKSAGRGQARDTLLFAEHGGARFLGQTPDSGGDIYALAVMFHEMVAGVTPFSDDDRLALSAARWHNEGPVLRPLPALSDEQNMILERALHWDPRQRLASAMAFIHAMTPSPTEEVVSQPPPAIVPPALATHGPLPQEEMESLSPDAQECDVAPQDDQEERATEPVREGDSLRKDLRHPPASPRAREDSRDRQASSGRSAALTHEAAWYQGETPDPDGDLDADARVRSSATSESERYRGSRMVLWITLAVLIVVGIVGVVWWAVEEGEPEADLTDAGTLTEEHSPRSADAGRSDSSAKETSTADMALGGAGAGRANSPVPERARADTTFVHVPPVVPGKAVTYETETPDTLEARQAQAPPQPVVEGPSRVPGLAADMGNKGEEGKTGENKPLTPALVPESRVAALDALSSEEQTQTIDTLRQRLARTEERLRLAQAAENRVSDLEERLRRAQAAESWVAELEARLRQAQAAEEKVVVLEARLRQALERGGGVAAKGSEGVVTPVGENRSSGRAAGGFAVQLDSFTSESEAEALVRQVTQIRFRDRPLPVSSRGVRMGETAWYRVVIASFVSRQEAEQVAKMVQERLGVSGHVIPVETR
ncbi:MAG: protein kinase [Magnetococcales bacterium]|nr:protein kinase [Magnetococcales bacterium]